MTVCGEINACLTEFYIMVLKTQELNVMKIEIIESEIYWWFQWNSYSYIDRCLKILMKNKLDVWKICV